jgi:hypothetical protein
MVIVLADLRNCISFCNAFEKGALNTTAILLNIAGITADLDYLVILKAGVVKHSHFG